MFSLSFFIFTPTKEEEEEEGKMTMIFYPK